MPAALFNHNYSVVVIKEFSASVKCARDCICDIRRYLLVISCSHQYWLGNLWSIDLWEIIGTISSKSKLIRWLGKKYLTLPSLFIYNTLRLSLKYVSIKVSE